MRTVLDAEVGYEVGMRRKPDQPRHLLLQPGQLPGQAGVGEVQLPPGHRHQLAQAGQQCGVGVATQGVAPALWRWSDRGGLLDRTQRLEEILMEVDRTFFY